MHSIIIFISRFFLYSIVMSAFSETASGLLISINNTFLITEEEKKLIDTEKEVLKKEIDDESKEINLVMPGFIDKVNAYFEWAQRHEVKNIFVLYSLCFIPIINIIVFFNNIHKVIKLFVVKFKVIFNRF